MNRSANALDRLTPASKYYRTRKWGRPITGGGPVNQPPIQPIMTPMMRIRSILSGLRGQQ